MPATATVPVIGAKPGTTVEAVPGKTFLPLNPATIEAVCVTELMPAGDGTYRPVVRICPRWVMLTRRNLRRFGIAISDSGMVRLIIAGFVKGMAVTPGVRQFDYFSYLDHERAVASDPEFWDRTEPGQLFSNRDRYRKAI
jgi:hypothetical protein